MKPHRLSLLALFLAAVPARADHPILSLEDGRPGPVTTMSALALPEGVSSASVQSQFLFCNEISDADLIRLTLLDEHVHSVDRLASVSLHAAHGLTEDLAFGFSLPYLSRSGFRAVELAGPRHVALPNSAAVRTPRHGGHHHAGGGAGPLPVPVVDSTDFEGLGDATLHGHYRFWHDAEENRHAALLFGIKTPTGRTDLRNARRSLIESDHQPGSGSWDPLIGLAWTRQAGRWSFDLSGLRTFANEGAQATDRGDIVNYNAAVSYRVFGEDPSAHSHAGPGHGHHGHRDHHGAPGEFAEAPSGAHVHPPAWDLILEANGDWRERVRIDGLVQGNTGGNLVFLSAGSRLTFSGGWSASLSVGIPVVSDLHGTQAEPGARLLFGVSRGF